MSKPTAWQLFILGQQLLAAGKANAVRVLIEAAKELLK
ncbi:hypothetical protein LCGC14_0629470 [marine sediment metagenome]|uniref:Uncharacterized protein n=1 Tax=marine sediment metagenome TaxID=412755 RepID=A0A0F9RLY9_9ZZZZ